MMKTSAGKGPGRWPRLILFDLDGTLIDSVPDLAAALGRALSEFELMPPRVEAVRAMVGEGQRILVQRALRAAGGDLDHLEVVLGRFRHHYGERLHEATVCYPGVIETLRQLPERIPKAVATNKPGAWARRLTAHLGLDDFLRWVVGEDDIGMRKPDPTLLHYLCALAGVTPAEALMVGDSRIDLEAAHAAVMPVAICTYGYGDPHTMQAVVGAQAQSEVELGSAERPYVLRQFSELLQVVPPEPPRQPG